MESHKELIVDLFAGGGGTSEGIHLAIGRDPDIAINHDAVAIAMHRANHPGTRHYIEDIWKIRPEDATKGRPVGLLWASPDCKHFSMAKGGAIVRSKEVRALAWVVVKWAKAVRPRVIILENVSEFRTWGPLDSDGHIIKELRGKIFNAFLWQLEKLGYRIDTKDLVACDFGAPTSRKRFFLVARCDGQPIEWPKATHGPGLSPWRTAAEIIDWTSPCPSIFERKKPLAENTMLRIAAGIRRYVIEAAEPFIVTCNHAGDGFRGQEMGVPFKTVTASGNHIGEIRAFLTKYYGHGCGQSMWNPAATVTTKDRLGLVTVQISGEPWLITDIGMRMLSPRELFRAQGFSDDYRIDDIDGRRITKTDQVRMCGNSVCPPIAAALVEVNYGISTQKYREAAL